MFRFILMIGILSIPAFTIAEGPKDAPKETPQAAEQAAATQTPPAKEGEQPAQEQPKASVKTNAPGKLLAKRAKPSKDRVRDSFRPPALKMESLNDELMRAAGENRAQSDRLAQERVKIEEERAALMAERKQLEDLVKKIEEARKKLSEETAVLEATLANNEAELDELKKARKINAQQLRAIAESDCTTSKATGDGEGEAAKVASTASTGRIKSLSKAIRNMKPKQAAQLLKSLDRDIAVELLRRMPARQAGAVLGSMKPAAAAMLATDLATDPDTGEVLP